MNFGHLQAVMLEETDAIRLLIVRNQSGIVVVEAIKGGKQDPEIVATTEGVDAASALELMNQHFITEHPGWGTRNDSLLVRDLGGAFDTWLTRDRQVAVSGTLSPFGWPIKFVDHDVNVVGERCMVTTSLMDALNNFVELIQKREDLLLVTQEAATRQVCWAIPSPITDKFILVARGEIERATNKVYNLVVEVGREEMVKVWLDARYLKVVE